MSDITSAISRLKELGGDRKYDALFAAALLRSAPALIELLEAANTYAHFHTKSINDGDKECPICAALTSVAEAIG